MVFRACFAPHKALAASVPPKRPSIGLTAGSGVRIICGSLVSNSRNDADVISAECVTPDEALETGVRARGTTGRNLERRFGPRAAVRAAKKVRGATLDLDDEPGTRADIVNLITSAASAADLGLANALAGFAGYDMVKVVILPAIPRYMDAVAVLE